eukprot:9033450-Pyramimonas_sp.AAC.1
MHAHRDSALWYMQTNRMYELRADGAMLYGARAAAIAGWIGPRVWLCFGQRVLLSTEQRMPHAVCSCHHLGQGATSGRVCSSSAQPYAMCIACDVQLPLGNAGSSHVYFMRPSTFQEEVPLRLTVVDSAGTPVERLNEVEVRHTGERRSKVGQRRKGGSDNPVVYHLRARRENQQAMCVAKLLLMIHSSVELLQ